MEYEYLAEVYDQLMQDVNYTKWANYIGGFLQKNISEKESAVLELACGTGNVTIPLAKMGYNITAVDRSVEMLSQAQQKSMELDLDIKFYQQNMLNLEINETFSSVLCLCDGVNYILDIEDLQIFFQNVFVHLEDGGLFIFDISSYYKLKEILGDNTYGEDLGNLTYLWENYFCAETDQVEMDLTFFELTKDGLYKKHKEFHVQKAYKQKDLQMLLQNVGFSNVEVLHELTNEPAQEDSHRIFFICRKP